MANVRLCDIDKTFNKNKVLSGLNLEVPDGSFMVMVGPSGCGKSTALRCIAGLEEVTSGSIYIGDRDVTHMEPKDRNIAMVFQNYALYPHMNVYDNITYGLKVRGIPAEERKRRAEEAAKLLGLDGLLTRMPRQLSGGQRQRVAMGRAIVREPSVFLFDEPLSNLDANLRNQMRIELRRLHQRLATTSIYVTHDQVEAMTLAEKILVLRAGHIEQYGTPDDVYLRPASVFVAQFMGSPSMNIVHATADGGDIILADGTRLSGVQDKGSVFRFPPGQVAGLHPFFKFQGKLVKIRILRQERHISLFPQPQPPGRQKLQGALLCPQQPVCLQKGIRRPVKPEQPGAGRPQAVMHPPQEGGIHSLIFPDQSFVLPDGQDKFPAFQKIVAPGLCPLRLAGTRIDPQDLFHLPALLVRTVTGIFKQGVRKRRHRFFFLRRCVKLSGQFRKAALFSYPGRQFFIEHFRFQNPRIFLHKVAKLLYVPDVDPGPFKIPGDFRSFPQTQIYPSHPALLSVPGSCQGKSFLPELMRRRIKFPESQVLHADAYGFHIRHIHPHPDPRHPGRPLGQSFQRHHHFPHFFAV